MAKYPHATMKLIPENFDQPSIVPWVIILHSAGGSAELQGWWNNPQSGGLESHFFVDDDDVGGYATVYQYVDTTVRADANLAANRWYADGEYRGAVSIETASTVNASEPWSPAQVKSIVRLLDWLCDTHNISRSQVQSPTGNGIGWHVMWGAPGAWTNAAGKVCPGPARIDQMTSVIIPAVQAAGVTSSGGFLMALTDQQQNELYLWTKSLYSEYGVSGGKMRELLKRTRDLVVALAKKAGIA